MKIKLLKKQNLDFPVGVLIKLKKKELFDMIVQI